MATTQQINAVVDAVIAAFESNPALWAAYLERARLETEYRELESRMRKVQAKEASQNAAFIDSLGDLQAELEAKQAEIDALNGA